MADRKTQRKHLFGSSEKTDFIMNLTDAGTKKLCALYCIIAMIIIEAVAIPYYLTKNVIDYTEPVIGTEIVLKHYVSEKVIYWASVAMFGIGLLGLCVFMIGKMKNQYKLADNKALLWLGGVMIMSLISSLTADELLYAFTGYQDRAEGFITLIGYYGFFAAAFTVVADNWRTRLCGTIIGIGAVNAVIGILQTVPALRGKIPNWFNTLSKPSFFNMATSEEVDIPAANGLAMTPHALAALLTVSLAVALAAFIFAEKPLHKCLSGCSTVVMTVAGILTRTTTALIGLGTAAVVVFVIAIVYAAKNKGAKAEEGSEALAPARRVLLLGCIGLVAVVGTGVIMHLAGAVKLEDEYVIRQDSERMLMVFRREDDSMWVYPYMWDDGLYFSEDDPLLGTGPDNLGKMQELGAVIDRSYNEYIDIAVQRGWITLGLYAVFLLITVVKGFRALALFVRREVNWAAAAAMAAVTAYMVQAFFNISALTSSPFFYICAGLCWSYFARLSVAEKNEKKRKALED